jgi:polyisoprenoid-binding protein YceI
MKKILAIFSLLIATTSAYSQTEWIIDKTHSSIRFTATHMLISEVVGKFNEFSGSVVSSNEDFNGSAVNFVAKVASIDTDNERRDNHLKSDDFFNAEAHPEITFTGKIEKTGDKYFLIGDFTMRETTKTIKFDVQYLGQIATSNGRKAGFKVTGVVNRFDYGLKWDRTIEAGGLVVGEDIDITCNLELKEVVADK